MLSGEISYNQRLDNFKKAFKLEEPDHVPIFFSMNASFALGYAGYTNHEGLWDLNILAESMEKFLNDFKIDVIFGGTPRSPHQFKILGAKTFVPNKEGIMQHPEVSSMKENEYSELIADPLKFIVEKALPRLYTVFDKPFPYNIYSFLKAYMVASKQVAKFSEKYGDIKKKHNVVSINGMIVRAPLDFIADMLRGFTGISMDIRRQPESIIAACNAIYPLLMEKALYKPPTFDNFVTFPLHMPPYMRTKDFEILFWPSFKRMIEELIERGYNLQIVFEGDCTRYFDYLQDLPKGKILARMEYGDIKLAKEKLGRVMCICGYYPLTLLKTGTKQQCIDKAKELLDLLAPGGGYVFSLDKSPLDMKELKVENLKAVLEYVSENGKY